MSAAAATARPTSKGAGAASRFPRVFTRVFNLALQLAAAAYIDAHARQFHQSQQEKHL